MTRHNIQRNWKAEKTRQRMWTALKETQTAEIPLDQSFWRLWHADRNAMKEAGYHLKKIDGEWKAFLTK